MSFTNQSHISPTISRPQPPSYNMPIHWLTRQLTGSLRGSCLVASVVSLCLFVCVPSPCLLHRSTLFLRLQCVCLPISLCVCVLSAYCLHGCYSLRPVLHGSTKLCQCHSVCVARPDSVSRYPALALSATRSFSMPLSLTLCLYR